MVKVTAITQSNIALLKFWGKRNQELNRPAVGLIPLTLKALSTRTTTEFKPNLKQHILSLNPISPRDPGGNASTVFRMLSVGKSG
jgi:diphosphomevalonate decarboxylase